MSRIFLGGSRKLSRLSSPIREKLKGMIRDKNTVLIGDANGADKAMQAFFKEKAYRNVIVYCINGECRNNVGNWEIRSIGSKNKRKDFKYFSAKDIEMSCAADRGFMLWDGNSRGTLNNVINLLEKQKSTLIYFSPGKSFVLVESADDLKALIAQCGLETRLHFGKPMNLSSMQQEALDLVS